MRVPKEAVELARQMSVAPDRYRRYGNTTTPKLPKLPEKTWYYIEGTVEMGKKKGNGQYRVVCLVNNKNKVQKKYYSPTHYGTGTDAKKKPTWIKF